MFRPSLTVTLMLCAGVHTLPVSAELFGGSSKFDFKAQVKVIENRSAEQYAGSERLKPERVPAPGNGTLSTFDGSYTGEWLAVARSMARRHSIPPDLFLRLVQQESGWNPQAVSHKGATGLAQLMPDTANLLRVDINNPTENLEGGARYLRMMYREFGSWRLALAAYNAGPQAVKDHGGIPPFEETQNYVRAILGS